MTDQTHDAKTHGGPAPKRAYSPPQVRDYGDLNTVTQAQFLVPNDDGVGGYGGTDPGGPGSGVSA